MQTTDKELLELASKLRELQELKKKIKAENKTRESDIQKDIDNIEFALKHLMTEKDLDMFGADGYKYSRALKINPRVEDDERLIEWLKEKDILDGYQSFKKTTFYADYRKWLESKKEGGDVELPPAGTVSINTYEYIRINKI